MIDNLTVEEMSTCNEISYHLRNIEYDWKYVVQIHGQMLQYVLCKTRKGTFQVPFC
jgi:hypothetical protein